MFRFILIVMGDGGGDAGGITAICRCQSRRVCGNETIPNIPSEEHNLFLTVWRLGALSQRKAACKEMCGSFRQIHVVQKRTLPTFLS